VYSYEDRIKVSHFFIDIQRLGCFNGCIPVLVALQGAPPCGVSIRKYWKCCGCYGGLLIRFAALFLLPHGIYAINKKEFQEILTGQIKGEHFLKELFGVFFVPITLYNELGFIDEFKK